MLQDGEILSIKQRFGIIGNSQSINRAIEIAMQVAPTDLTVLITGESGSGKESFSKIIHHLSHRKHGPFIAVNCGAIPEGTIDSELFGHEKGAFTGAAETRKGYFETVNKGTIFLDEIGEMPFSTQARLLRILENGEYIKVGSSKIQKTDVRVVAATNVKLLEAVEKGKFREDLYYRLNTVPIFVPPLRDRGEDVLLLFRKFAMDFAEKYRRKSIFLTPDAEFEMLKFRFPGNIRQLKNIAEQMSVLETDKQIDSKTLSKYLPSTTALTSTSYKSYDNDDKSNNSKDHELLYKVIIDMKKEVDQLKNLVLEIVKTGNIDPDCVEKHAELFDEFNNDVINKTSTQPSPKSTPLLDLPGGASPLLLSPVKGHNISNPEENKEDNTIDITDHEIDDSSEESLSIEKNEKELITKALLKHNNKRKYAAQELGISERTLYRKIKQYGLEK